MKAYFDRETGYTDPEEDARFSKEVRIKDRVKRLYDSLVGEKMTMEEVILTASLFLRVSLDLAKEEGAEVDISEVDKAWKEYE
jgi:hypothetical protein